MRSPLAFACAPCAGRATGAGHRRPSSRYERASARHRATGRRQAQWRQRWSWLLADANGNHENEAPPPRNEPDEIDARSLQQAEVEALEFFKNNPNKFAYDDLPERTRPFDESVVDTSWYINMRPGNLCVVCQGEGSTVCFHCAGRGYVVLGPEPEKCPETDQEPCPVCEGAQRQTCLRCEGSGKRPLWVYDRTTHRRRIRDFKRELWWKREIYTDEGENRGAQADGNASP